VSGRWEAEVVPPRPAGTPPRRGLWRGLVSGGWEAEVVASRPAGTPPGEGMLGKGMGRLGKERELGGASW